MKTARFAHRADALFRALSSDYLLREQFVTDPARIVADYIMDDRISPEAGDAANQLVYAVMSNRRLVDWLGSLGTTSRSDMTSRHKFAVQLAHAVAANGDELAVLALIRAAAEPHDYFRLQTDVLRAIAAALGARVSQGTEFTPGTGTEFTPGTGGTNVSPASMFSAVEVAKVLLAIQQVVIGRGTRSSGTEFTPGTGGTNVSPGTGGTNVSPAGRAHSIEEMTRVLQLVERMMLARSGVFSSGTEFTPGTGGTNVSPGTGGTNISPAGRAHSIEEMVRVLQTIQRVVNARGVFSSGTEFTPGTGGTNVSPGTGGTNVSPGGHAHTVEEMTRVLQAVERLVLARPGVFTSGTEFTPGTGGTNVSPGTGGTNVSPGGFKGVASITIEALSQYATRLRARNALQVSGLEEG